MNITGNDAILLAHGTFGVLGTASALWVFVETLNAQEGNAQRIRTHNLFMETKEHLFLATLILSFYLPIAARDRLHANAAARRMVLSVAMLIVLTGLSIEGAGAVIDHGVKVALLRPAAAESAK